MLARRPSVGTNRTAVAVALGLVAMLATWATTSATTFDPDGRAGRDHGAKPRVAAAEIDDPGDTQPFGPIPPFPSAAEISEVLGADVELRGVEDGLSQLWEGIEFDWQELPRAQSGIYVSSEGEAAEGPLAGVIIDIAEFENVEDAMRNVDDVVFADDPSGFETDLTGDFVAGATFGPEDGMSGSFIFLREGPMVMAVSVFATEVIEVDLASHAIVVLVQDRLGGDA